MSRFSSLHDLKTLIRSFHALVLVETVEEERLSEKLEATAEELDVALFDWSSTCGLARYPDGRGIGTTAEPGKLISHLLHLEKEAVYHLRDYHAHLRNAAVIRAFRELCQHFARFDLARLASSTDGFSGAEIEQIVVGGLYGALQRDVDLDDELLLAEAAATVPLSVTRREDIASLRELARERFVPVSSAPAEGA